VKSLFHGQNASRVPTWGKDQEAVKIKVKNYNRNVYFRIVVVLVINYD